MTGVQTRALPSSLLSLSLSLCLSLSLSRSFFVLILFIFCRDETKVNGEAGEEGDFTEKIEEGNAVF